MLGIYTCKKYFGVIPYIIAHAYVVELRDLRCARINYTLALLDTCSPSIRLALINGIIYMAFVTFVI